VKFTNNAAKIKKITLWVNVVDVRVVGISHHWRSWDDTACLQAVAPPCGLSQEDDLQSTRDKTLDLAINVAKTKLS